MIRRRDVLQLLDSNRHPADQLGEVRALLRALRWRECELRRQLLDTDDRDGEEWQAYLRTRGYMRVTDVQAALDRLGDALAPFVKTVESTAVMLRRSGRRRTRATTIDHSKRAQP
jgi:hypothetical protein